MSLEDKTFQLLLSYETAYVRGPSLTETAVKRLNNNNENHSNLI